MSSILEPDGTLWKYMPNPPIDDMEYLRRHAANERECPVCNGDGYEMTWTIQDAEEIDFKDLENIRAVNVGTLQRPWFVPARPACTFCEGSGWVVAHQRRAQQRTTDTKEE